jgi:Zn-finger nucleic acid-binding protein
VSKEVEMELCPVCEGVWLDTGDGDLDRVVESVRDAVGSIVVGIQIRNMRRQSAGAGRVLVEVRAHLATVTNAGELRFP